MPLGFPEQPTRSRKNQNYVVASPQGEQSCMQCGSAGFGQNHNYTKYYHYQHE